MSHGPMGSYCRHSLFNCSLCGRPGRCDWLEDLHPGQIELWDVDGLGPTCKECLDPFSHAVCMRWLKKKHSSKRFQNSSKDLHGANDKENLLGAYARKRL